MGQEFDESILYAQIHDQKRSHYQAHFQKKIQSTNSIVKISVAYSWSFFIIIKMVGFSYLFSVPTPRVILNEAEKYWGNLGKIGRDAWKFEKNVSAQINSTH